MDLQQLGAFTNYLFPIVQPVTSEKVMNVRDEVNTLDTLL